MPTPQKHEDFCFFLAIFLSFNFYRQKTGADKALTISACFAFIYEPCSGFFSAFIPTLPIIFRKINLRLTLLT